MATAKSARNFVLYAVREGDARPLLSDHRDPSPQIAAKFQARVSADMLHCDSAGTAHAEYVVLSEFRSADEGGKIDRAEFCVCDPFTLQPGKEIFGTRDDALESLKPAQIAPVADPQAAAAAARAI